MLWSDIHMFQSYIILVNTNLSKSMNIKLPSSSTQLAFRVFSEDPHSKFGLLLA